MIPRIYFHLMPMDLFLYILKEKQVFMILLTLQPLIQSRLFLKISKML